jgi:hypothetical protein
MRRFVVRRKFSGGRKLLCFTRRLNQFVFVITESGLETDTKYNGAGVPRVNDENSSCLPGLRNTARISPARHDLDVFKLLCGSSYCATVLWHPSASAAPAAQDFAKQRDAHNGAMITANSAAIAMSAVVRRFFLEKFVSLVTSSIRYATELCPSTQRL